METPRTTEEREALERRHKQYEIESGRARHKKQTLPPIDGSWGRETPCLVIFLAVVCIAFTIKLAIADSGCIHIDGSNVPTKGGHPGTCGFRASQQLEALGLLYESCPVLLGPGAAECIMALYPGHDRPPRPAWTSYAVDQGVDADVIAAIEFASDATRIPGSVLLAIGTVESGNTHPCTGDGGRAIGWGQIHTSPWRKWASKELERPVDLHDLEDNVLVAALILEYSGYHDDELTAYAKYNGGPNPNYRYGRMVARLVEEIGQ